MTEDINRQLDDYYKQKFFWTDKALSQLGFANNLFIVISIAILGYLFKNFELENKILFSIDCVNLKITAIVFSALFSFFSIMSGITTVLSRLYDLRITRHLKNIVLYSIGKSFYLVDLDTDINSQNKSSSISKLIDSIKTKNYYISIDDLQDKEITRCKFRDLKKRTETLGALSWRCFLWQIYFILLSIFTFIISLFF